MGSQVREIQYFFSGQNFTDGLRITLGILLPSLILAQFDKLELGVLISIGALSVSIADFPGPPLHKRNGMLFCCLCIYLVALITGFARMNQFVLGAEVLVFSFFFSMLAVYGQRAAAIGTASLLVMVLSMDEPRTGAEVVMAGNLVLAGGVWYMLLSFLFYRIRPYRPVQQALGACVHEMSRFLLLKASFYRSGSALEEVYQSIVQQQIVVNEKQEAVRELLFKSRQLVKESTNTSRRLLLIFIDLVDLFEQISLIHTDYAQLRERFGQTGVLDDIAHIINLLAEELDAIGYALQNNARYQKEIGLNPQLEELLNKIDTLQQHRPEESVLVLKKVLINLRNITQRLNGILSYLNTQDQVPMPTGAALEYARFVSHQYIDLKTFKDNLSFSSSIFKHALRVALVCLFGYALTKMLLYGEHSYWVLLTIVVILKPAFSLTKERNFQRLLGTVIGGIIGFCILFFIQDQTMLFVLLVLLMIGTFSFIRVNYVLSVILMTPFILIIFNFLGADNNFYLLQERILDTLIGSAIAFTASYLLFPSWESEQLQRHMQEVLTANLKYLQTLVYHLMGKAVDTAEYKLARKEVYVSAANLSAAFQRMLSEPKDKQIHQKEVHKFVVLNHVLSSNIATVFNALALQKSTKASEESIRLGNLALARLAETRKLLGNEAEKAFPEHIIVESAGKRAAVLDPEEGLLREQLEFIHKLVMDIEKNISAFLERHS